MKELVVISGKGGTGKTSLMAAFASLAKSKVLCDSDVDAADLHLLTDPKIKERHDFQGGGIAVINPDKCTECGLCRDLCRWEAISEQFEVDSIECEGCGVCVDFCPEQAIDFPLKTCGQWFISDTRFGPMVHARLGIAEENSGKLVALVRQEAKKLAEKQNLNLLITDGPPGIGCPVIASIGGATALLIVTEPTVSGLHDMERVAQLAAHFKVPGMVCVNKFDLNLDQTQAIEKLAKEKKMAVLGRIPFDLVFTKSMVQGKTIFEYNTESIVGQAVKQIWRKIIESPVMNEKANV
ncbi:MAG: P-loop NTPase [Desulfobacterales bacterium]